MFLVEEGTNGDTFDLKKTLVLQWAAGQSIDIIHIPPYTISTIPSTTLLANSTLNESTTLLANSTLNESTTLLANSTLNESTTLLANSTLNESTTVDGNVSNSTSTNSRNGSEDSHPVDQLDLGSKVVYLIGSKGLIKHLLQTHKPLKLVVISDLLIGEYSQSFIKSISKQVDLVSIIELTLSVPLIINGKLLPSDSYVVLDALDGFESSLLDKLQSEVNFGQMMHKGGPVPRLVCTQGIVQDGWYPIYRHPTDKLPPVHEMTPLVKEIKEKLVDIVGHELNHCLIQLYRDDKDYISEHSDKTLDIDPTSSIVNVSIGSERVFVLKHKDERWKMDLRVRDRMVFVMGLGTNKVYMHSIKRGAGFLDKQVGERISLTFRLIHTFRNGDEIRGRGSKGEEGHLVVEDEGEREKMYVAFSRENHEAGFEWSVYGDGFDVID